MSTKKPTLKFLSNQKTCQLSCLNMLKKKIKKSGIFIIFFFLTYLTILQGFNCQTMIKNMLIRAHTQTTHTHHTHTHTHMHTQLPTIFLAKLWVESTADHPKPPQQYTSQYKQSKTDAQPDNQPGENRLLGCSQVRADYLDVAR